MIRTICFCIAGAGFSILFAAGLATLKAVIVALGIAGFVYRWVIDGDPLKAKLVPDKRE